MSVELASTAPDELTELALKLNTVTKAFRGLGGRPNMGNKVTNLQSLNDRIELATASWTRKEGKRESGGLNQKGVDSYRRENPGSKLKTAVTKDPSKLKKGGKAAKRRASFCRRMKGMKAKRTSAKTANDPNSRINKSLRAWNCEAKASDDFFMLSSHTNLSALEELMEFAGVPKANNKWRSKKAWRKANWARQQPPGPARDLADAKYEKWLESTDRRLAKALASRKHPNHRRAKRIDRQERSLR